MPQPLTNYRATKARSFIAQAFDAQRRWAGNIPDPDEMDQFEATVKAEREYVLAWLADLERAANHEAPSRA